jgi:tRNA threonylcarbamoyladenosine biosynthesis protein TsaE
MEIFSQAPEQTIELAKTIAPKLLPGDVIALTGDLGSGKTFFTSALTKALNIKKRVQSPTFVLVREYHAEVADQLIKKIYHVDLYRLEDEIEVVDIGLESFFSDEEAITIIEWPQIAQNLLPERTIHINFEMLDEHTRRINVQNLR